MDTRDILVTARHWKAGMWLGPMAKPALDKDLKKLGRLQASTRDRPHC